MSSLRQLKVTFDSFDDLVESVGPGLSRTRLFARTDKEIAAGTRVRLELGTVRKGAVIRGVAKVAGPGPGAEPPEPGLDLHIIHLDPSSTRLVDSIVRGEIAPVSAAESSDPGPFDIPPAEQPAEPLAEPASVAEDTPPPAIEPPPAPEPGRLLRFAWPLALAILAGALLLVFELVTRDVENPLLTGRDRELTAGAPAAGAPAAGTGGDETDSAPPAAPPAAPGPAAFESIAPGPAAPDLSRTVEEVDDAVRSWASAWSRQDAAAYLEHYAPDYSPQGQDRETWQRQRRDRVEAPEQLEVTVSDLDVEIVGEGRARVRFHQLYATGKKRLAARKTLELERLTAGWRIVTERVEP